MGKKYLLSILFLISFIFLPETLLAASGAYDIYTYGSGDFIATIFDGVKMIFADSSLLTLLKILLLVGGLSFLVNSLLPFFGRHGTGGIPSGGEGILALIRQALLAAVAIWVIITPRVNVAIVDRMDPAQTQIVGDVPLAIGVVAHFSSVVGDSMGKTLEQVLTPVDSVKFANSGMAFGAKYLNEVLDILPPGAPSEYGGSGDIPIRAVIEDYFETCIFPWFANIDPNETSTGCPGIGQNKAEGLKALEASVNILNDPIFQGCPFRDPNRVLNISFDTTTCNNALTQINQQWDQVFDAWIRDFNNKSIGRDGSAQDWVTKISEMWSEYFGSSYTSGNWQTDIKQIAMLNAIRGAYLSFSSRYGSSPATASEMARRKSGSGWIETARFFNKMSTTLRQMAEATVYGLSFLLPIMLVVGGFGAIGTYIKINLWLQLWIPLYIIINAFADASFVKTVQGVLLNSNIADYGRGFSFHNIEALREQTNLILGYIGAFAATVPMLAWGLLRGGEYAMSRAVAAIGGVGIAGTAGGVGQEVGGSANLTLGHTSMGHQSFMASGSGMSFNNQATTSLMQSALRGEGMGNPVVADTRAFDMSSSVRRVGALKDAGVTSGDVGTTQAYNTESGVRQVGEQKRRGIIPSDVGYTGAVGTERNMRNQMAAEDAARHFGYDSVGDFQAGLSGMDYSQKGQMIDDWANFTGQSDRQEAARDLGRLTGDSSFVNSSRFTGSLDQVGGLGPLADLQYTSGQIDAASLGQTIREMKAHGMTPSDFGGTKAFMEAAGTIAAFEQMSGGALSKEDILDMKGTGLLTEAGRTKAAHALADRYGHGSVKDFAGRLGTWEGAQAFHKFNELENFAGSKGTSLDQLLKESSRGATLSVDNAEARKLGLPGAGRYSASWDDKGGMLFTNRDSGASQRVGFFSDTGSRSIRHDESETLVGRGTSYKSGNDVLAAVMNNDGSIIARRYGGYLRGNTPTEGGIALVDHMVSQIGGYGKFSQAVRDSMSAGWKAEVGGSLSFGKILTTILSGGTIDAGIGISGNANATGNRMSAEEVNADTLRLSVQRHFREIMGQDKPAEWKAQQLTSFMHSSYELMEKHGTMNTFQQMKSGADNPLKESPLSGSLKPIRSKAPLEHPMPGSKDK